MARLPTQPKASTSQSIPLRSGFFSIPFKTTSLSSTSASKSQQLFYLQVRLHNASSTLTGELAGEDEEDEVEGNKLFITSLPLNTSSTILTKVFNKLYPNNKVVSVQLIEPINDSLVNTLQSQTFNPSVQPLFNSTDSTLTATSPISAILTFQSQPSLSSTFPLISWPTSSSNSFLKQSKLLHALARPHLSSIIAHSDSWMSNLDAKKIAQQALISTSLLNNQSTTSTKSNKPSKSLLKKKSKNPSSSAVPGSSAHALSLHLAHLAKQKDRTINPDEVIENPWTLVSKGGKHGKSLLPDDVVAGVSGYGGVNVGVARNKGRGGTGGKKGIGGGIVESKGGEDGEDGEEGEEKKVKSIVGEGFYSFSKADTRRAGKFSFTLSFYHFLGCFRSY